MTWFRFSLLFFPSLYCYSDIASFYIKYFTTIFHRHSLDTFLSEYQPHIKGSDGNKLNPIFDKKIQGQKLPGRWVIAESKLPRFRAQLCISNWVDMDRHNLPNNSPVSTSFFFFIFLYFLISLWTQLPFSLLMSTPTYPSTYIYVSVGTKIKFILWLNTIGVGWVWGNIFVVYAYVATLFK